MRKYLTEFLGTLALVFAGCGAIVVNDLYGGTLGHVGVSIVFGLVVMAMIYAIGSISGAHINPALRWAFYWPAHKFQAGHILHSQPVSGRHRRGRPVKNAVYFPP